MKFMRRVRSVGVRSLTTGFAALIVLMATLPSVASANVEAASGRRIGATSSLPYQAPSGGFVSIDATVRYACALASSGDLYCWGDNSFSGITENSGDGTYTGDAPGEVAATPPIELGTGLKVNQFDIGYDSQCAVLSNGSVKCWGQNPNGELGLGDTAARQTTSQMGDNLNLVNLGTGVTAIQVGVGNDFACALTNSRDVKCWGANSNGELGQGDTVKRGDGAGEMGAALNNIDLGSGVKVRKIEIGAEHSCALTTTGSVKCWGRNQYGQLGNGNISSVGDSSGEMGSGLSSVSLPTGTVQDIFGGKYTTCVRMSVGSYCWGLGQNGIRFEGTEDNAGDGASEMGASLSQMSLGTYEDLMSYETNTSLAFAHACSVTTSGQVKCVGENGAGQLGRGNATNFGLTSSEIGVNLSAIDLGAEDSAVEVAVSDYFSCALLISSEVKCWGKNNYGQLGIGSTTTIGDNSGEMGSNLTSVPFSSSIKVESLGAGGTDTCATLTNGTVKCWGQNSSGQLGQGNITDVGSTASSMLTLNHIRLREERSRAISSGMGHTCAILESHKIQCWGKNDNGQLGLGDTSNRGDNANEMGLNLPYIDLGTGAQVVQLALGNNHTCALLESGVMKCWGDNSYGQLGKDNTNDLGDASGEMGSSLASINLGAGRRAIKIAASGNTSCAVLDNGTAKCWGSNSDGQLGQGTTATLGDGTGEMSALAAIDLDGYVVDIQLGTYHACAILDNNSLKCWGDNTYGQLGYGNTTQLGDGTNEMGTYLPAVSLSPVIATRTVIGVSLGNAHTCALLNNHAVKCWGKGLSGQLGYENQNNIGDGSAEMGLYLSQLNLGTGRTVVQISVGSNHSCALLDNGTAKCWGMTNYGQAASGVTKGATSNTMGDNLTAITVLENIAPTATWSAGSTMFQSVSFSLDFSEPTTGLTSGDFTTSGTAIGCAITSTLLSSTSASVQADCTSDGTVAITLAAESVSDYAGNTVATASTSSSVALDTTAPTATVTSPTSPAGTLNPVFRVDFNESVAGVAAGDFSVAGTATPCTIVPASTSGTSIEVTTQCSNDGTVTLTLNANRVYDLSSNNGPTALVASSQVTISRTYPTSTITPPSSPRSSRTLSYGVVFNQSVTGFATTDVTNVGTATCATTSVTGSGTTYTVILTCTTDGTATLRIAASSVTGTFGAGPTVAENATTVVIDATGPTAAWSTPTSPIGSLTATFDITFNEDATIGVGDVTSSGTATGCGTPLASSGPTSWSVSVTCTGDGTVALTLGAGSVPDSLGNYGPASATTSSSITLDTTAPTVLVSTTATTLGLAPFEVSAVFNESISGLDGADFSNTGTAAGCAFTPSSSAGISFTVSVSCTGAGTVVTRLADRSVADQVANIGPTSAVSASSVTLDASIPTADWSTPALALSDRTPEFTITFGAAVTGLTVGDLAVIGGSSATCSASSLTTLDNITYTATVTCTADVQTVGLRLAAGSVASASTTTAGPGTAIESGLVKIDTTAPTASWSGVPASPSTSRTLTYSIDFSETVFGIDDGDFGNSGSATGCTYTTSSSSGSSIDVDVTCSSDGTVVTEFGRSGTVIDIAGNIVSGTPLASTSIVVDSTFLSTIWSSPSSDAGTRAANYIVNFGETIFGLTSSDFTNRGTATGCTFAAAASSGISIAISVGCSSDGSLEVVLRANSVSDAAGNTGPATDTSATSITLVLATPPAPTGLITLAPKRIMNTRATGKIGSLTGTATATTFNVHGKGGLPTSGISAVVLNVTVVEPEVGNEGGFLSVYPCASGQPDVSNLNFTNGTTIPNTVIAPVDPAGNICFYSYGKTHVLADISGYFPS